MMSEAFIIFVNSAPQTMCVFIFVAPHISASIGKTIANKLLYKYKCGVISHCSIGQNFSIFGHVEQNSLVYFVPHDKFCSRDIVCVVCHKYDVLVSQKLRG